MADISYQAIAVLSLAGPAPWVVLAAYLYFLSISVVLTRIDIATHRLPNAIVLPGYVVGLALFTRGVPGGRARGSTCCAA